MSTTTLAATPKLREEQHFRAVAYTAGGFGVSPQQALTESVLRALAASDSIGVAVCDREFRYLLWNGFMEAMTGMPAAEVLGRNALDLYPHLRGEGLERVLHRVLAGETVSLPDRRFTVPGARSGLLWAQYSPHRAPDGSVAGVVGLVHEVVGHATGPRSLSRMRLGTELRHALDGGALTAHYQPIVSLATGRICGMEALARWRHAERGWVAPHEFVASAEETGMIARLGRRVLSHACRHLRAWTDGVADGEALGMSVNLSVRQFAQPDLVRQVKEALDESGVAPSRLRLEVTESIVLDDAGAAAATLARLKELGVSVWMDDFGTGYSSLSTLHRLPVDGVKVDRSFLAPADGRAARVLAAVVGLAHSLGLEVVAEGVERADQLAAVRALGCDAAQGFLFSPALPADAMTELLRSAPQW